MVDVQIIIRLRRKGIIKVGKIREIAKKVLCEEGVKSGKVEILFCGDRFIRRLNREFRGVDSVTDVLAFPFDKDDITSPLGPIGEVVISFPTAVRNAERFGNTIDRELSMLVIHGLLHVIGWDHSDHEEDESGGEVQDPMRVRERRLFELCRTNG
jgi:rRNA maturation RNase YbeY